MKVNTPEKAIEDFNEGIKNLRPLQTTEQKNYHKWLVAALYNRYDAYLKTNNHEKASEDLNEIKEIEPGIVVNSPPNFLFFLETVRRIPDIYLPASLYGWKIDLSV